MHRLQLNFLNVFIATIGLICFDNLNVMHLCRNVSDIVYLKCCSKWVANESVLSVFEKT